MAKESMKAREVKRAALCAKYAAKRAHAVATPTGVTPVTVPAGAPGGGPGVVNTRLISDPYANIPSVFPHIPQASAHIPLSAFPSVFPDCTSHHMFAGVLPDLPAQNPYNCWTDSSAGGL